jgi:4-hydroxy-3-methylbut-2-enyl diphosphate reductase IspH
MRSDELLVSELGMDVDVYVNARQAYGIGLFQQLVEQGLYVNGVLYYQLRNLDNNTLVLEKMCVPLTDHEIQQRRNARQIDTTCRRVVSAFNARIAA